MSATSVTQSIDFVEVIPPRKSPAVITGGKMFQPVKVVASLLIITALFFSGHVFAAARLESLTVGYSNFTGTYGPLWIAVEERVGAKYGLDLKAIYAGRVRPQQLLATGEMPVVLASATGTLTSHIVGVKDHVFGCDYHKQNWHIALLQE